MCAVTGSPVKIRHAPGVRHARHPCAGYAMRGGCARARGGGYVMRQLCARARVCARIVAGYAVRVPCGCRGHAVGMARVCRGHAMRGALWRVLRGMAANARGRVARGMAGAFWAHGAAFWRVAWRGE